MADQDKGDERQADQGSASQTAGGAGDPGRTPGAAEGDRETVEDDLQDKENKGEI